MSTGLVDALIEEARRRLEGVVEAGDTDSLFLNPDTVLDAIRRVRDQACQLALSTRMALEAHRQIRKIYWTVGGAAIIALNGGGLVVSLGLGAPFTAVSGALGGALILRESL